MRLRNFMLVEWRRLDVLNALTNHLIGPVDVQPSALAVLDVSVRMMLGLKRRKD